MNEKVKLPKEVAEAIEKLRSTGASNFGILNKAFCAVHSKPDLTLKRWAFEEQGGTVNLLMLALVNGYEVEMTLEDKLLDYYNGLKKEIDEAIFAPVTEKHGEKRGIRKTLEILGIRIIGINALKEI